MEASLKYNIASDFSEYPGPRYIEQGSDSGEEFYYSHLKIIFEQAEKEDKQLIIVLDGVAGYASSFLDEAFGNLTYDFTQEKVVNRIKIISEIEPDWINMIFKESIPEWESRRIEKSDRKRSQSNPITDS